MKLFSGITATPRPRSCTRPPRKTEEFIVQESKEIEQLLKSLDQAVADSRRSSGPGNREKQNKINQVTQTINTKIEASLAVKPGDERINRLYDRAVKSKDQAQDKGFKVQLKEPDKQLTSSRKVYQEAIEQLHKGASAGC